MLRWRERLRSKRQNPRASISNHTGGRNIVVGYTRHQSRHSREFGLLEKIKFSARISNSPGTATTQAGRGLQPQLRGFDWWLPFEKESKFNVKRPGRGCTPETSAFLTLGLPPYI